MDLLSLQQLLQQLKDGEKNIEDVLEILRHLPFRDLESAKHDVHRPLRNAFSEVIFCDRKEKLHLEKIITTLHQSGQNIFGTRLQVGAAKELCELFPQIDYDPISKTFLFLQHPIAPLAGNLALLCAGTADIPVAEEAWRTARYFGVEATRYYDVGVAGLPRLLTEIQKCRHADAIIIVAGMEGALPSVVGGLTPAPLIAVPTSVGYGTNFGGITALLGMLNSCSEGICVVNIDNGFGAACVALRILRGKKNISPNV
ncbi:MAG: hypothetical protein A3I05_04350 [Deltaproteobacteria bacterium RIFCSPLOWO2_02_FULL_44_10]|nr:MAG: hypothetical protein A3C46_07160 [Deltaproteobacteria bacterium RIFCSPHIGHO2_02_FULL_44_16]OGQ46593.1 MAG: hypothetical protein A3I05_04350 [Deltaproteobacteria bacterium RIFCSPLOWO2_02_FULL_44_10]